MNSRPMGAMRAADLNHTLTAEMASTLRAKGADLDDASACMAVLVGERFRSRDVAALIDGAMAEARRQANAEADPQWAKDQAWGGR